MSNKKPQSIFAVMATDQTAEENGRWFNDIFGTRDPDDAENFPGVDVCLRRLSSKKSLQLRAKLEKEHRNGGNRFAPIADEITDKIVIEQLAKAVLVDWRGIFDEHGEVIPFSVEAAIDLLTRLPNFRNVVLGMSHDIDNFRSETKEAIAGN